MLEHLPVPSLFYSILYLICCAPLIMVREHDFTEYEIIALQNGKGMCWVMIFFMSVWLHYKLDFLYPILGGIDVTAICACEQFLYFHFAQARK